MAFKREFLVVMLQVVAAAELVGDAAAATYVVGFGDILGWTVPRGMSDYTNWASQHVFRVGDVVVFNSTTNLHDVAQVMKPEYDSCASTNPILLGMTGPWNTALTTSGDYYFICTFNGHCGLGQKLSIKVTASSPSPTPPSPGPPPPPPPNSAMVSTVSAPVVGFALLVFGFMI